MTDIILSLKYFFLKGDRHGFGTAGGHTANAIRIPPLPCAIHDHGLVSSLACKLLQT
ncbi:hypothetical protein BIWAKO_05182 [Bosea sp. BIWAKO-01]|nr:hypothetical protein BIWAKO_05182 [Bosea sp. BIWAKO-01]